MESEDAERDCIGILHKFSIELKDVVRHVLEGIEVNSGV